METVDTLIIGAGISGIGAARQLQDKCPDRSFLVLEARERLGGTWDLFRYPGVRSDSDMHTMGYASKPWRDPKAIADGPSILAYLQEAAAERGIDRAIRFGHRVVKADWSSADARWTVECELAGGERRVFRASFLFGCSGYYSYRSGHDPEFKGRAEFTGTVVHPQQWPSELDYRGKRVVVIGSGATAITLVPAMAREAAKVTMLQRSPTYVVAWPAEDKFANRLKKWLPAKLAYWITRWKNVWIQRFIYRKAQAEPAKVRAELMRLLRKELSPGYDVDRHFSPRYMPWQQRLCMAPDGDFFKAINSGRAEVVTDRIERFTPTGIRLESGAELPADIIVTATGLESVLLGEAVFSIDGEPVNLAERWSYRGMMFSGVPNLVYVLGYVNASWTLRAELVAEFGCRLLNHLRKRGAVACTPRLRETDKNMQPRPLIEGFTPNYLLRAFDTLPHQGDRAPWQNRQDYLADREEFRKGALDDGVLCFDGLARPGKLSEVVLAPEVTRAEA
jgi:cation diffusion facilitator CzcD-associated flavoprotein CzcO